MEKLDWMPLYIDKLLSSPHWQGMKDFQRGWYIQLLLRCTRSEPLGYLRMDSNLWTIAGARRKDYWDAHGACVLACFKVREMEGHRWIYNERLLSVMEMQSRKYRRTPRDSALSISPHNLDVDVGSKEGKVCSKACRIPEDFIPNDDHYTIAAELGINCDMEFQKFRDYFLGLSGQKAVKRDWDATLRNWLRNALNFRGRSSGKEPSKAEKLAQSNLAAVIASRDRGDRGGPKVR
jgi:hypothetical protein